MDVSYKKLFKLLIDRDMKKKDLHEAARLSSSSITKLYIFLTIVVRKTAYLET